LKETADGKTYAQVSTESRADPKNTELAAQVQTLFRGETLRGLLLEAYGFWKFGQIAFIAAVTSFALGAVMLVLSILGLLHLRRTDPAEELGLGRRAAPTPDAPPSTT
jgi:hypothetical protein